MIIFCCVCVPHAGVAIVGPRLRGNPGGGVKPKRPKIGYLPPPPADCAKRADFGRINNQLTDFCICGLLPRRCRQRGVPSGISRARTGPTPPQESNPHISKCPPKFFERDPFPYASGTPPLPVNGQNRSYSRNRLKIVHIGKRPVLPCA